MPIQSVSRAADAVCDSAVYDSVECDMDWGKVIQDRT